MNFLDHQSEVRSQIDNRAFISVQTASGGGVFLSINSLIKIVEIAPQLYHTFVLFIGLNALSFLLSLIGILVRRETNRRFSQAKTIGDANGIEASEDMQRSAWRWSNMMWSLIIASVLTLVIAYTLLIHGLYGTNLAT